MISRQVGMISPACKKKRRAEARLFAAPQSGAPIATELKYGYRIYASDDRRDGLRARIFHQITMRAKRQRFFDDLRLV